MALTFRNIQIFITYRLDNFIATPIQYFSFLSLTTDFISAILFSPLLFITDFPGEAP